MRGQSGLFFEADKGGAGAGAGDAGAGAGAGNAGAGTAAPPAFDWKTAGLPAEDLAFVTEKGWKSVVDQTQSYRSLEKLVGAPPERIIKLPGEKDPPESWDTVYNRLGRPEKPEAYQIPLPEGDKGDFAKQMAPIFHKAGLSQAQVKALAEGTNAHVAAEIKRQTEAASAAHETEIKTLKTEWGAQYEKNEAIVNKAAESFGMTKEQVAALKQSMGPRGAMRFLYNIGSKISAEGTFVAGEGAPGFEGMTPEQAQAKIAANRTNSAFVQQFNSADPKVRADARAEMERLNKIAFPDQGE